MKAITKQSVKHFVILLLIVIGVHADLHSQEKGLIPSKYYSTKDYDGGTQNWAITQDLRGFLYFGNIDGVLEFDGETWRKIETPNRSTVRSLNVNDDGVVFVGAFNELGYLWPNSQGMMEYHSLIPLVDEKHKTFNDVWDINCFSDTVFFLTDKFLFIYSNNQFEYIESGDLNFYLSHSVGNSYYVQEIGVGLSKFENGKLNLIEKGDFFRNIKIHSILPYDTCFLICSRTNGLYLYNCSAGKSSIQPISKLSKKAQKLNRYFTEHLFYHGVKLDDNHFALASITGNILIVNKNWEVVDAINEKTIGVKSATLFLYFQKNHSLWLALDNGICQVDILSPLRYWNQETGINGLLTDVARIGSTFYVSTGSGIFYTQSQSNAFETSIFKPVEGRFEQAWQLQYFYVPPVKSSLPNTQPFFYNNENTLLLAATTSGLHQIIGNKSRHIINNKVVFRVHQSIKYPNKLILGLVNGFSMLEYKNGEWINIDRVFNIDSKITSITEDSTGNLWLTASHRGIYRVTNPFSECTDSINYQLFDTTHGLPVLSSIQVFNENNRLLFYANRDYYTFNDSTNHFSLFDLYSHIDSTEQQVEHYIDSLWFRSIGDNVISDFYVTHEVDTAFWFGTNSAIYCKRDVSERDYHDLSPAAVRKVLANDSTVYFGTNISTGTEPSTYTKGAKPNVTSKVDAGFTLQFKDNSVTFHYAWPFYEGKDKNLYSYKLIGYQKEWSDWNPEIKKEYTNLPEGDYIFMVKGKNIYNLESTPAEFYFSILPPWYRTYYAYLAYFLLSVIFIALVVKLYTWRLIKEKDRLEILVKERTQEILIQKEEILVQAEHLKDANDWISAKNVELQAQKNEIVKKKDQLEISNATKNKFFRIIAHDLRSPISTLVNSTSSILTDIDEFDKERTKFFIEQLNKLSLTTYNLLENLLDWSTSQMGEIKYNPTKFEVNQLINEVVELTRGNINLKNIKLSIILPEVIEVYADENMVHTVIRNLFSNAIKFTNETGEIIISLKTDSKFCYLSIRDNGVGISPENIDKLFRIDKHISTPGTHNEKGSGLGLILCKEFVERNGGMLTVESEPGKGSTFTASFLMYKG